MKPYHRINKDSIMKQEIEDAIIALGISVASVGIWSLVIKSSWMLGCVFVIALILICTIILGKRYDITL